MTMKRLFTIVVLATAGLLLSSCGVNPTTATRALEAQGLTNVRIEGYSWLGCGKEDTFASNVSATGVNGVAVTGQVCQGLFKGTTVRYD